MLRAPMNARPDFDAHGDGSPVVLLHSFPLDRRMWRAQCEALAANGFRALALDLPGFGATPLPPHSDPTLDVYVDAALALLDHLGLAKAVFVGLSLGGYVALRLAARAPSRVRALVLADTRAGGDAPDVRAGRILNLALVRSRGSVALVEKLAPHLLAADATEAVRAEVIALGSAQSPEGVAFALLAMRDRPDSTAAVPSMSMPALVLVGQRDTVTPPAEHRTLADMLPNARYVEVAGAGHLSNLERPDAFNAALLGFLHALEGRAVA